MPEPTDNDNKQPDRRKFILGAAAIGAGAGGLLGSGLIAPKPAIAAGAVNLYGANAFAGPHQSAADLGLTKRYPVEGYPGVTLPFPTNPAQFLQLGLKTLFGVLQVCLCVTPQGVMRFVGMDKVFDATMKGGLGVTIGEGQSKAGKNTLGQLIHILFHPTDHFSEGLSTALGVITFSHDGDRPVPPSFLSPVDPGRVLKAFGDTFLNPLQWPNLAARFLRDPMGFFQDFIRMFFPGHQNMRFNVKVKCEAYPDLVLVNRNTIEMSNSNVQEFPPRNAGYAPAGTVELVDIKNPTGPTVVVIEQFNSVVSHKEGAPAKLDKNFINANVGSVVTVDKSITFQPEASRLALA